MKKRWLCWILCAIFLVGALPVDAEAATTYSMGWWGKKTVKWKIDSIVTANATYAAFAGAWISAVSSWSDCSAINLVEASSVSVADIRLSVMAISERSTFGMWEPTPVGGDYDHVLESGIAYINVIGYSDTQGYGISDGRAAQSAAAHELEHAHGLNDETLTDYSDEVMCTARDRRVVYMPTSNEISEVEDFYENWDFSTWKNPND